MPGDNRPKIALNGKNKKFFVLTPAPHTLKPDPGTLHHEML